MTSSPQNFFPIDFKRNNLSEESPYNVDTAQLFTKEHEKGEQATCSSSFWERCYGCFAEPELDFYKLFYFFFHAATAMFAYLPLYYTETLLLDHHRVGLLMGVRPFCRVFGAPFLGTIADKFDKYKATLYTGLLVYIAVYLSITFIADVPNVCGDIKTNFPNISHRNVDRDRKGHISSHTNNANPLVSSTDTRMTMVDKPRKLSERNIEYYHHGLSNHGSDKTMEDRRRNSMGETHKQFAHPLFRLTRSDALLHRVSRKVKRSDNDYTSSLRKPRSFVKSQKRTIYNRRNNLPNQISDSRFWNPQMENSADRDNEIVTFDVQDADNSTVKVDKAAQGWWENEPETAGENAWPYDIYRGAPKTKDKSSRKHAEDRIFLILLLLTLLSEVMGAPIDTLADTATLQSLKKEPHRYGHQRVWASIGFCLMSIATGSVLHYTITTKEDVKGCPEKMVDRYRIVFYSCCALLVLAFFTSLKMRFRTYEGKDKSGCSFFRGIKYFQSLDHCLFVGLAWLTGLAAGLRDSFLFVHLIHMGATPIVLVVTTAVQGVSNVIFFCLSPMLLIKYGHFNVIYAGLVGSFVTFFYYSFLQSPWMVVPIEILAGLTTSLVWASLASYVGAPPNIGATMQGILHAIHMGMGRGIGGLFGGMIIVSYGFDILFRSFSVFIALSLIVVYGLRQWREKEDEPISSKLWDYSPIASSHE